MVTFDSEKFGSSLSRWRAERGLGVRQFARQIKISPTTLLRIENGGTPDMETFTTIVGGMGWKAEPFFARPTTPTQEEG